MQKQNKITVIIPIHEMDDTRYELLKKAMHSLSVQTDKEFGTLFVVTPQVDEAYRQKFDQDFKDLNIKYLVNKGKSDYVSQINWAATEIDTEWFSVLEFDDLFGKTWIHNAHTYLEAYPECKLFLPLVMEVNPDMVFIGLNNEMVWATEKSKEFGIIDFGAAKRQNTYSLSGMVMHTESFILNGGLKRNIKIFFNYELLLRLLHSGMRVMVIPKIGYTHTNHREGSYFEQLKATISDDEGRFWLTMAKKEYQFNVDREITYKPQVEPEPLANKQ